MSAENVATMTKIMSIFNTGDLAGVEALIAPNVIDHQQIPGIDAQGLEGFKFLVNMMHEAYPDMTSSLDDLLDSGDKVVARSTMRGTNTGPLMGMPPTGKAIEVQAIDIVRFENGLAVEHWGITEDLKMMQQLGLIPSA